ncbi:fungal mating-type pheromone [Coprinopsis cinerea okayama7|uniref:Fungal mating-type pheromone n=1 Tax=Coprinopsis cinerea (strain Okayama-7 / 130 / ATCC MYA-4618 / FGSC 9003) TaxID=240176 RepID=D6RM49_COPC7|nr:fungal mating-type pheromone [Coprinopsis cinerea okayama7\|eukprot:XP_002911510.1 fungal mating-type pheromone [Coprinopsis cinerea okayama7\
MDSFTIISNVRDVTSVPTNEETGGGRGNGAYCVVA